MSILSNDLLDSKLASTFYVSAQPHQTETSSTQQLALLKSIGKTIAKCLLLLLSQPVALVRLFTIRLFLLLLDGFDSPLLFLLSFFLHHRLSLLLSLDFPLIRPLLIHTDRTSRISSQTDLMSIELKLIFLGNRWLLFVDRQ